MNRLFIYITHYILIAFSAAFCIEFNWEVLTTFNDSRKIQIENDTLYAATSGGIVIYSIDNQAYTSWNSGDGLSDHNFTAMYLSDRNSIILGTQNGILLFFDKEKETFFEDFSLEGDQIRSLIQVEDTLWVATKTFIATYLFNKQKNQYQFSDFYNNYNREFSSINDIFYFNKNLWAATDNGLFIAPGNFLKFNLKSADTWEYLTSDNGFISNNILSFSSLDDTLLIGTDQGLTKYWSTGIQNYSDGLATKMVENISVKNKFIYVNNSEVIYKLNSSRFIEEARISQNSMNDFALDTNENLWVALKENGLKNLSSGQHIRFNGPIDNTVGEALLDQQDRLWLLSGGFKDERRKGFSVLQSNGIWKNFKHLDNWGPTASAQTVMEDMEGNIWIGAWNGGLCIINPNLELFHFNNYTSPGKVWISSTTENDTLEYAPLDSIHHLLSYTKNAPELLVITDILMDSLRQSIWLLALTVQSGEPILQYKNTTFNADTYNKKNWSFRAIPDQFNVLNDQVAVATLDIFNNLWIGTENSGVVILQLDDNGTINWFDVKESDNLKNPKCLAIAADQDGYVWIGTYGGLNAYFNGQIYDLREDYQPIGLQINKIFVDSENNKWFATDRGLSLLRANGSPWDSKSWEHFVPNSSDLFGDNIYHSNLPSEEIRSVFVDQTSGDVYCSTMAGLAILRSNPFTTPLQNLDKVKIGPNPFLIADNKINQLFFRNLTANSIIKILTTSGHLVRTLKGGFGNEIMGSFAYWDGRNEEGRLVSSGVYLYLILDDVDNSSSGKIVVIKQ